MLRRPVGMLVSSLGLLGAGCDAGPELRSPKAGSVQTAPWIPVLARLPEGWEEATAVVAVDGVPVPDAAPVIRRRYGLGGGVDLISAVDLLDLPAGEHELSATVTPPHEPPRTYTTTFTWAPPPCLVTVSVQDGAGAPRAAQVRVQDDAGAPFNLGRPQPWRADPRMRDDVLDGIFVTEGEGRLRLPRGRYTLLVHGGLRDAVRAAEVDCGASLEHAVAVTLPRVLPLPGWITTDLHVHTARSADAYVPDRARLDALKAADLDRVVLSDHRRIVTPDELPGGPHPGLIAGMESRIPDPDGLERSGGHINAFPLSAARPAVDEDLPLEDQLDAWRDRQRAAPAGEGRSEVVLQLNHPRGIGFVNRGADVTPVHDIFNTHPVPLGAPLAPVDPRPGMAASARGTTALDADAIEILNRFSWSLYREVRRDWFDLLDRGVALTGTGNSDSHALRGEVVGFPVTLLPCPAAGPGADRCLVDALQRGRAGVSNGPVVSLEVSAPDPAGAAQPGALWTAPDRFEARVRVQAAPWVPVQEVRLVQDGVVVFSAALEPRARSGGRPLDETFTVAVEARADGWLLAEAGWPLEAGLPPDPGAILGVYAAVVPGHLPVGFTNPVFLDGDGDGAWTPADPAR